MSRLRFVLAALGGAWGALWVAPESAAVVDDHISASRYLFLNEFLFNMEKTTIRYDQWKRQQPNEFLKWTDYVNAIRAGQPAVAPSLTTKMGRAMVAVGKITMLDIDPLPVRFPGPSLYPSEAL